MGTGLFDDHTINIPCDCGRETTKTIGWLKTHDQLTCACGATIHLDKSKFTGEIADVDRAWDELQGAMKLR